jgi:flavin-dependent dehydrogenase
VTGEGGVAIEARYPRGLRGLAIRRADLDLEMLEEATMAGARFDGGVRARQAIVADTTIGPRVEGVLAGDRLAAVRARVTIAADGRRSALAFALGLSKHAPAPKRWAIGAYFSDVRGVGSMGEMHIRRGRYIGVAPVPGGLCNVCLVTTRARSSLESRDPGLVLTREVMSDATLRDRFAGARLAAPPTVLGPLAVDTVPGRYNGLLVAGDAAGFIDPMTGDGLRFAVRGGELAAAAALSALGDGWPGVHDQLEARRRREFGGKWRLNRALRAIVSSPAAIGGAGFAARLLPGLVRRLVERAGDCDLAAS